MERDQIEVVCADRGLGHESSSISHGFNGGGVGWGGSDGISWWGMPIEAWQKWSVVTSAEGTCEEEVDPSCCRELRAIAVSCAAHSPSAIYEYTPVDKDASVGCYTGIDDS